MEKIENIHIAYQKPLITPYSLKNEYSVPSEVSTFIHQSRETIQNILEGSDHRLLVILGPCSIHDIDAAYEYAKKLKQLSEEVSDTLYLVMRVYFEKPRTTVGWKGLINDPHLDDSFDIEHGLTVGRELLLNLSKQNIPLATEALDPITPQYFNDLITWSAIGARTTESQTHREMASGLSSPVGLKNTTDGSFDVVLNALTAVAKPHCFLGVNSKGIVSITQTLGNKHSHVVLRGGKNGSNYDENSVKTCEEALTSNNLPCNIMIDCSHENSSKDHKKQSLVVKDIQNQIKKNNKSIMGLMLESHLYEGKQSLTNEPLKYGVSITDACIGWGETKELILSLRENLKTILPTRKNT